ncbi:hypothetical protein EMIT0P218_150048 [Pseudomonas sp. IT-P218]
MIAKKLRHAYRAHIGSSIPVNSTETARADRPDLPEKASGDERALPDETGGRDGRCMAVSCCERAIAGGG